MAYASGIEVVEPDLWSESNEARVVAPHLSRPHDRLRYRSIVAVPIKVNFLERPWGVVVATSDRKGHFSQSDARGGVRTVEAARSVAAMVALAVEVCNVQAQTLVAQPSVDDRLSNHI